jgi:glycosyltransferase involved in cell wall biosynthesis
LRVAILNVTCTFVLGGSESYVWSVARYLLDRGHIVTLYGGAVPQPFVRDPTVPLVTAPFLPRQRVRRFGHRFGKLVERVSFAWQLRRQLVNEPVDIVNIHKPFDIPFALWLRGKTGCKIVWRCHGTDFFPALGPLVRRVDAIYCVSEHARRGLLARYPVPAVVIYTGVDTGFFRPMPRPSRATPSILFFGRLVGWKGVEHLVRALGLIAGRYWEARLVGEGPKRGPLEALCRDLGIADRVRFHGPAGSRGAVRECLAEADVVVFPSLEDETFSNALLEAMSMGKAIVASAAGGLREAVQDGKTGLLVRPADPEALSAAILHLLDAPDEAARLGSAARVEAEQRFDARRSFEAVERLFLQLTRHGVGAA